MPAVTPVGTVNTVPASQAGRDCCALSVHDYRGNRARRGYQLQVKVHNFPQLAVLQDSSGFFYHTGRSMQMKSQGGS